MAEATKAAIAPEPDIKAKVDSIAETVSFVVENTGQAIRENVVSLGAVPYDFGQKTRLTEQFGTANTLMTNMIDSLLKGGRQNAKELASIVTTYVIELAEDGGHVISNATDLAQQPEITSRSVRMSILAMAIAIEMGYDEDNVRTVGLSGLVHDWGMFLLEKTAP